MEDEDLDPFFEQQFKIALYNANINKHYTNYAPETMQLNNDEIASSKKENKFLSNIGYIFIVPMVLLHIAVMKSYEYVATPDVECRVRNLFASKEEK